MNRLLILVVLFASGCGGSSKNENAKSEQKSSTKKTELTASTPEEFAQSIVTLLAANDPNQFVGFAYLGKKELLAFIPKMIPADRLDKVTEQIETDFELHLQDNRDCFAEVRNELAGNGCDWNQAEFVRAEYEIRKQNEFSATFMEVTLSAGDRTYQFVVRDCILVNGRWFTFEGIRAVTKERVDAPKAKAEQSDHGHDHGGESDHGHGAAEKKSSPRQPRAEKVGQKQKPRKLTAEEATSLLADELGRWKVTGKNMPVGGEVEPFDFMMEARWMVKGKSIEFAFSPLVNGERVPFVGHREYDPQEGLFIWRTKGEGFPETSGRDQYDPATKTYRGRYIHADGAKETKTCELVGKDKMLVTSQFEFDGKVVFTREGVFTRLPESGDRAKK